MSSIFECEGLLEIVASLHMPMYLIGSPYSSHLIFSSLQGNMGNDLACLKKLLLAFASSSTMRSWRCGVLLCTVVGLVATEPELGSTSISSSLSSDNSASLNQITSINMGVEMQEGGTGHILQPSPHHPITKTTGPELVIKPCVLCYTRSESLAATKQPSILNENTRIIWLKVSVILIFWRTSHPLNIFHDDYHGNMIADEQ